jgi:hypothetical protein
VLGIDSEIVVLHVRDASGDVVGLIDGEPSMRVEMAERKIASATRRSASHTKVLRLVVNRFAGVAGPGVTRGTSDICLAI